MIKMHILLTGGTGLIGSALLARLTEHNITLLTRSISKAKKHLLSLNADVGNITYIEDLSLLDSLNHIDIVINLAGKPIAEKRWTTRTKEAIASSRWQLTQRLVDLIQASTIPPALFISASAVGYYGDVPRNSPQTLLDESANIHSEHFLHLVCKKWEQIALQASSSQTRVCLLRSGVILSSTGGALPLMKRPYLWGLGGNIGDGQHYLAWIDLIDAVNAILWLCYTPQAQGIVNLCSPQLLTYHHFGRALAKSLHRPHCITTPKWLLRLIMGEACCLLTDNQPILPQYLLNSGFTFTYPEIEQALSHLNDNKN